MSIMCSSILCTAICLAFSSPSVGGWRELRAWKQEKFLRGTFHFSVQNRGLTQGSSVSLHPGATELTYTCFYSMAYFTFPVADQPWRQICIFSFLKLKKVKKNALILGRHLGKHYPSAPIFFPLLPPNDQEGVASITEGNHWSKIRVSVISFLSITAFLDNPNLNFPSLHPSMF